MKIRIFSTGRHFGPNYCIGTIFFFFFFFKMCIILPVFMWIFLILNNLNSFWLTSFGLKFSTSLLVSYVLIFQNGGKVIFCDSSMRWIRKEISKILSRRTLDILKIEMRRGWLIWQRTPHIYFLKYYITTS